MSNNLLLILVALGGAYYLVSHYFLDDLFSVIGRLEEISEDQGSGRLGFYDIISNRISNFGLIDWLLGRGYHSIWETGHTNAHNDALQVLYEYGLAGLVVYILITIQAIKRIFYLYKNDSQYAYGYVASIIIYIVLGLVSNLYAYNTYFIFICAYWGLMEGEIISKKKNYRYV